MRQSAKLGALLGAPAPISSTQASLMSANSRSARRTAVNATDTGLAPIRVSLRTRLATAKVCCISRSIGARMLPALRAAW